MRDVTQTQGADMTPLDQTPEGIDLSPIARLTRDLLQAARVLSDVEAGDGWPGPTPGAA